MTGLIAPTPEEQEYNDSLLGRVSRGFSNLMNDPRRMAGLGGIAQGLLQAGAVSNRPISNAEAMALASQGAMQNLGQYDQQRLAEMMAVSKMQPKPQDNYTDFKIDDLGQAWGRNKATGVFEKIPMQSDDFAKYKTSTYVDPATGGVTSVLINPRDVVAGQSPAGSPQGGQAPSAQPRPGVIEIGGQRTTQANEQAMSFYNRMRNASSELDTLAQQGFFNPGVWDKFADAAPGSVQAFIQSDDYRRYKAAASDWIKATLRKESGAAIPDNEMDSYFEQYFPQPGESQAVVEQKKRARAIQEKNMMQEAGPALQRRGVNEAPAQPVGVRTPEQAKAAGWKLMTDANGNRAYVGPDNQIVEVK